jgi:hypothetical protein
MRDQGPTTRRQPWGGTDDSVVGRSAWVLVEVGDAVVVAVGGLCLVEASVGAVAEAERDGREQGGVQHVHRIPSYPSSFPLAGPSR